MERERGVVLSPLKLCQNDFDVTSVYPGYDLRSQGRMVVSGVNNQPSP